MPAELLTPGDAQQAAQQAGIIPFQPVPTNIQLGAVDLSHGDAVVAMQVSTPVGMSTYFLSPQEAGELGRQLRRIGRLAALGLTVVGDAGDPDE